jgi:hypothetical protein
MGVSYGIFIGHELTRGQFAPLLYRSLLVPRSTLPHLQRQRHVFLRSDLRRGRADYFANNSAIPRLLWTRKPNSRTLAKIPFTHTVGLLVIQADANLAVVPSSRCASCGAVCRERCAYL